MDKELRTATTGRGFTTPIQYWTAMLRAGRIQGLCPPITNKVKALKRSMMALIQGAARENPEMLNATHKESIRNLNIYWWRNQLEDWTYGDGVDSPHGAWQMSECFDPGYYYIANYAMWCVPESAWEAWGISVDDR